MRLEQLSGIEDCFSSKFANKYRRPSNPMRTERVERDYDHPSYSKERTFVWTHKRSQI